MKIGILGGTFDPIHNGHIKIAEETKKQLVLDKVMFVPAGQPWMKVDRAVSPARHRVEMLRLAIAGHPDFELSLSEVNRPGSTYTVETISDLRAQFGEKTELFFIVGWDGLLHLPQWKDTSRLVKLCRIVAVPRPGYVLPDFKKLEKQIPGLSDSLILLDKPEIAISATEIRKRVAEGLSIHGLVPAPVADYIKEHNLYIV